VRQKYWSPQFPDRPVPVSLVKAPGWTMGKKKTRHADAACWYHQVTGNGVDAIYPLVFTRDTAGDWYEEVSELWDLTQGELQPYGVLTLLRRIAECIEQGLGRDEAVETRDAMLELLQELR
jgi:hypothetical protein